MDIKRWLAAGFGLGWLPFAPGSWGSLLPAGLFALEGYLGWDPWWILVSQFCIAVLAAIGCIGLAGHTIALVGDDDPPEIVLDEFAGQGITFLALLIRPSSPYLPGQITVIAMAGYILFRFFDTIKPWPCRPLEHLPGGWGILADDLVAGLYALVVLTIAVLVYGRMA